MNDMKSSAEHHDSDSTHTPPYDEKNVAVAEGYKHGDLPPDPDEGLSDTEKAAIDKKLLRKLDLRLIPWLCLLYLISFLDRTFMTILTFSSTKPFI